MPRRPRSDLDDGVFHVTARAVDGAQLFVEDVDRLDFLRLLEGALRRFCWTCPAYCLMGTHYHVVLAARRIDLSTGMRWLNGTYAQRFNQRYGRRGHLFAMRFASWVLHDERHLEATLRYVLENPVRAGLCSRSADWPWSSVPATLVATG